MQADAEISGEIAGVFLSAVRVYCCLRDRVPDGTPGTEREDWNGGYSSGRDQDARLLRSLLRDFWLRAVAARGRRDRTHTSPSPEQIERSGSIVASSAGTDDGSRA